MVVYRHALQDLVRFRQAGQTFATCIQVVSQGVEFRVERPAHLSGDFAVANAMGEIRHRIDSVHNGFERAVHEDRQTRRKAQGAQQRHQCGSLAYGARRYRAEGMIAKYSGGQYQGAQYSE